MPLRARTWTGKDGKTRTVWMIDVTYVYPDGKRERVRQRAVATSQRAAEAEEQQIVAALVAGTFKRRDAARQEERSRKTVAEFAREWLDGRRGRGIESVVDDTARLEKYVLPFIGTMALVDVRPHHVRDLVRTIRTLPSRKGGTLAPRTVRHAFFTLKGMFHDAVVDEIVAGNPCVLRRGELPKKTDKDPVWRASAIFTRTEVEAILSDERIPEDRRVVYALLFLGGVRFGEASALRWRCYEPDAEPLGRLLVATSFSTRAKKEKSVKTESPRQVPVHKTLAKTLARWKLGGWRAMTGRTPQPDDLLVPSRVDPARHRRSNLMLERFHEDCVRIGLRPRRQHDARRTFITLARAGGASKDILHWVTHGPTGDIDDLYTTLPWATLCGAVGCLDIGLREGTVLQLAAPKSG